MTRSEIRRLCSQAPDAIEREIERLQSEVERLRAQLAEAVEMLRFYAMKENWGTKYKLRDCGCCTDEIEPLVFHDNGTKARAFLEKLEGP